MTRSQEHAPQSQSFFDYLLTCLYCACCLVAGIIYAYTHHYLAIVALCSALCACYTMRAEKKHLLYGLLFFVLSYTRLYFFMHQYQQTIAQLTHHPNTIIATVQTIEQAQHAQYRYAIGVTVHSYVEQGIKKQYRLPWQLQCYSMQKPMCNVSDTIKLNDIKIKTAPNNSFGSFLLKEGIHATAFFDCNACSVVDHPPYCLNRTIHHIKCRILTSIRKKCSYITTTLVSSIFLGNRLYVKQEYKKIKDLFCNWGIMHFLARSGVHMVIFILFLQYTLQWLPIAHILKQILLLLLSLIYTLLSWQSVSFSRALCTFVWYKACGIAGLQTNIIYVIILLSCLFLLCNPMLLFFLDFQLSFGITLVLAIINHYIPR